MADREPWMDDPDTHLDDAMLDAMLFRARSHGMSAILTKDTETEGLPGCWVGGSPSLPPDVPWPCLDEWLPYHFIGQFDLSQLPLFAKAPQLPEKGMLYFFFFPLFLGDGGGHVIYLPDATHGDPLRTMPPIPEEHAKEIAHATEGARLNMERYFIERFLIEEIFRFDYSHKQEYIERIIKEGEGEIKNSSGFRLLGGIVTDGLMYDWEKEFPDGMTGPDGDYYTRLLTVGFHNILGVPRYGASNTAFWIKKAI